jgi:hypothetical protein
MRGAGRQLYRNKNKPQALSFRTPEASACGLFVSMIKNSERQKQKRQEEQEQKLKASRWLAGLVEIIAVDGDGNQRVLEREEAATAIIRHWEEDAG